MSLRLGFKSETVLINGVRIDFSRKGRGRPFLVIHGEDGYELDDPGYMSLDQLTHNNEVFIPRLPGFGRSSLPDFIRSAAEVSYIWLDFLDHFDLKDVTVVAFSVGGWLALEMASKSCSRIRNLVLCGSVGVKFGGPYDRDIGDIYFHNEADVRIMKFHNPENDPHFRLGGVSKRAALALARQKEAIVRFCWDPYFHNPSLRHRLNRITIPTLVVQGVKDGFTLPKYGRALARAIPDARYVSIPMAGHFPHLEQPEKFGAEVASFLSGRRGAN